MNCTELVEKRIHIQQHINMRPHRIIVKHYINSRSDTKEQTLAKHKMKNTKTIQNKLAQKRKHKFP